ncbi:hypothetical protein CP8484711_1092B, partial [Chlamydia psittaci 84-8471/1]
FFERKIWLINNHGGF